MPKPLAIERMIGARMDLPFGMGSARKIKKWQEEQLATADKVDSVKAEAEKIAETKAAEAAAAKAAFEEPAEEAIDVSEPAEVTATPAMSQSDMESEPATEVEPPAPAPEAPAPAPADDFFGKVVGMFSQRGDK